MEFVSPSLGGENLFVCYRKDSLANIIELIQVAEKIGQSDSSYGLRDASRKPAIIFENNKCNQAQFVLAIVTEPLA